MKEKWPENYGKHHYEPPIPPGPGPTPGPPEPVYVFICQKSGGVATKWCLNIRKEMAEIGKLYPRCSKCKRPWWHWSFGPRRRG